MARVVCSLPSLSIPFPSGAVAPTLSSLPRAVPTPASSLSQKRAAPDSCGNSEDDHSAAKRHCGPRATMPARAKREQAGYLPEYPPVDNSFIPPTIEELRFRDLCTRMDNMHIVDPTPVPPTIPERRVHDLCARMQSFHISGPPSYVNPPAYWTEDAPLYEGMSRAELRRWMLPLYEGRGEHLGEDLLLAMEDEALADSIPEFLDLVGILEPGERDWASWVISHGIAQEAEARAIPSSGRQQDQVWFDADDGHLVQLHSNGDVVDLFY